MAKIPINAVLNLEPLLAFPLAADTAEGDLVFIKNKGYYAFMQGLWVDGVFPRKNLNISEWVAGVGATSVIASLGPIGVATGTGAVLTPLVTANLIEAVRRARYITTTTAGTSAGYSDSFPMWLQGNILNYFGIYSTIKFAVGATSITGGQIFVGLADTVVTLAGEPSANSNNFIGIGKDSTDVNWQFMRRSAAGAVVKVDLGLAVASFQQLIIEINAKPTIAAFEVVINRVLDTGIVQNLLTTTVTTTILANNIFLGRKNSIRNGAVAAAMSLELVSSTIYSIS